MRWIVCIGLLGIIHFAVGQVRVDHVIAVVNDLDSAKSVFIDKGFLIKEGRLHDNGLLNAHIKFANQSSFELITVKGTATDPLARQYQSLLTEGEGGVFLALTGHDHDSLKHLLQGMHIPFLETNGKWWRYLSFPEDSKLAHLFFIDYLFDPARMNDPTDHPNGISRIASMQMEGAKALKQFLRLLGLTGGADFNTSTGLISVIPIIQETKRPRLTGITFEGEEVPDLQVDWRK
ncbi:MAG: VOC family protein [Cytophagales bacterium]|nr:VOC family protein [Cytophagales bacterium]